MRIGHPDLWCRVEHRRRAEMRHRAEQWRLLRQSRSGERPWLARSRCWLLCQVGRTLVWIGQRLESLGSVQVVGAGP
jgi:hypothetical protein